MLEFTLRHPIHCSVARYWQLFIDPQWTRTMIMEGLGFSGCEITQDETNAELRRTMHVIPKIDVPQAVAKLLGSRFAFHQHDVLDKTTMTWNWRLQLSVLADKIRMSGIVRCEPEGPARCVRISTIRVDVRIFGLGKLVERAAENNLRDGWARGADWINGWLARNPAS